MSRSHRGHARDAEAGERERSQLRVLDDGKNADRLLELSGSASPGSTTPARLTAPTWKLASGPRRHLLAPPMRRTYVTLKGDSTETDAGGGPWRTRLLRLECYPVTFGDRCDSTATCLVTFLRTALTPLTPLFVVTV